MRYDEAKIDEAVLAVLYLTTWEEHGTTRAWKGIDWHASNRLHERGLIDDPKSKNKSVYSPRRDSLLRERRRKGSSRQSRKVDRDRLPSNRLMGELRGDRSRVRINAASPQYSACLRKSSDPAVGAPTLAGCA
jgi:hypothetical protein